MPRRLILAVLFAMSLGLFVQSCDKADLNQPAIDYSTITNIVYSEHVQPILDRSCAQGGCHDGAMKASGLDLTSWNRVLKGSSNGEVIIPSMPARSLLTTLFDGTILRKAHPPIPSHPIANNEVQFLKRWIAEGAKNDAGEVPYAHSVHKLYVPNQAEDVIAVIDMDSLVVFRYVNVGVSPTIDGPHFIAANHENWYVSLIGTGEVWKFDSRSDTLVGTGRIPGSPALLALTPDGSKLYVSQFSNSRTNQIAVMNTQTMTVSKTIDTWVMPHGMRMDNAGTRLYVANMFSDNISVIDVASDSVIATVPLAYDAQPFGPPKYMPMEIAVSPDDSIMLATCSETREVRMFSTRTLALVDSFAVGDEPWHIQFTPDGVYSYVTNRRGNSVSVIHLPMRHVMNTITADTPPYFNYPHGCDVSPDGQHIFVSNENSGHRFIPRYNAEYVGNVCVIDNLTNQIVKVLEVGKMPTGLGVAR
jgi:YVTN family beta-propeller protein